MKFKKVFVFGAAFQFLAGCLFLINKKKNEGLIGIYLSPTTFLVCGALSSVIAAHKEKNEVQAPYEQTALRTLAFANLITAVLFSIAWSIFSETSTSSDLQTGISIAGVVITQLLFVISGCLKFNSEKILKIIASMK